MTLKRALQKKSLLFFGDIFLIILSLNLAFIIRLKKPIILYDLNNLIILTSFILIGYTISFYIFDLYNIRLKFKGIRFFNLVFWSLILMSLFSMIFFYFFPFKLGRGVFIISLVLTGISITIWRMVYSSFLRLTVPQRNVLIVGPKKKAEDVYALIKMNPEYKVVGLIDKNMKKINLLKKELSEDSHSLEKIANNHKIDDIIITIDPTRNRNLNKELVSCKMKGINIYDIPALYEALLFKIPISYIKPKWFLYTDGFDKLANKIHKRLKRIIDLLISSLLSIISFPMGIIISFAIKINSKGPIFLMQERVGENNKSFKIIKFRTMATDAEKGDPKWAEKDDPRITFVGKILRKTRLDELPQLINVIKGEMSLTGPRPEREFFVKKLMEKIPFYSLRFSVKPGLTGWAQINYKYGDSDEDAFEKLQYDLYYVKNMSTFLDIGILLQTIRIVLFGTGR